MGKTYTEKYSLHFDAETSAAKQKIQELYNTLHNIGKASSTDKMFSGGIAQIQQAQKAAQELEIHLQKAMNVNTGKLNLKTFTKSLNQSGQTLSYFQKSLSSIGPAGTQAFNSMTRAIMMAEKPLFNFSSSIKSLGESLANSVKWQISSSAIHGIMGAAQKATGHVKALNKSLTDIRIVSGQSADQMERFAKQANQAAKDLRTTTTAYTDAALIFYQQGLNDQSVKERTETVLKMSNITGESAEEVSSYMTAIWNNFDNGTKSLEYYADAIAALGAATASSSEEIAAGLDKFAAIANTVGLSYEYATSALATVVSETRQSADVVGTAFKTIFSRLEGLQLGETLEDGTSLNKYSAALASVGVNIKDQNGQLKQMDQILDELGSKWKNLGRDQQVALAQTVAGTRQYTQLISLMENYDSFKLNVSLASDSEGTLQKQADIYAESWEAAKKRVTASAEAIYQALLNDDLFIDLNNGFASILDSVGAVIKGMGGLAGMLPAIASLMLSAFGPQISSWLSNAALHVNDLFIKFGNLFNKTDNKMLTSTERMRQEAANMYIDSFDTSADYTANGMNVGQTSRQAYAEELGANMEDLVNKSQQLTGFEKQIYDLKMQNLQATTDQVMQSGKQLSSLEKQIDSSERLLKNASQNAKLNRESHLIIGEQGLSEEAKAKITKTADKLGIPSSARDGNFLRVQNKTDYYINPDLVKGKGGIEKVSNDIRGELMNEYIDYTEKSQMARGAFGDTLDQAGGALGSLLNDKNKPASLSEDNIVKINGALESTINTINDTEVALGQSGKTLEDAFGSKISGQITTLQQKLQEIPEAFSAFKNAKKELAEAEKAMEGLRKGTDKYKDANEKLGRAQTKLNNAQKNYTQTVTDAINAQQGFNTAVDTMDAEAASAREALVALGVSSEGIQKLEEFAKNAGLTLAQLVEQIKNGKYNLEQLLSVSNKQQINPWVGLATDISKIITAISAIKSIDNIWSNDDVSTGEKLLSTLMSFSMILPTITSLKLKDNIVSAAQVIVSRQTTKGKITEAGVRLTNAMAAEVETGAVSAALAVMIPYIAIIAAVALAVGALISVISSQKTAQEEATAAAERASATAEQLKERYNEVKNAYEELKSSLEDHNSALESIKELTAGTLEWKQAIADANSEVLDLISTYPELAKYVSRGEGGVLQISEEGQEEILKQQEVQVREAQAISNMASLNAKKAAIKSQEVNAISEVGGGPEGLANAIKLPDLSIEDLENKIMELSEADDELSVAVREAAEAVLEGKVAMEALTDATRLVHTEAVVEQLADNEKVQKSQNKDAIVALSAATREAIYDETYQATYDATLAGSKEWSEDWGIFGDYGYDSGEEAVKDYVTGALGGSNVTFEDWYEGGVKIKYTDSQNERQETDVTYEAYAMWKANADAADAVEDSVEKNMEFLDKMAQTGGELAEAAAGVVGAGSALHIKQKDLEEGKMSAYNVAEASWLNQSWAPNYDIQITTFQDLYNKALNQQQLELEKINNRLSSPSSAVKLDLGNTWEDFRLELSTEAYGGFVDNFDKIIAQFGQQSGKDYFNKMNQILQDNEINNPEFIDRLQLIDVTAEDSSEQIRALAKEFYLNDEQTRALVNSLDDFQLGVVQTAEVIAEQVADIEKITKSLDLGKTIKTEEFTSLQNLLGDQINSFFTQMADGTYMLTMDAEAFYQMVQDRSVENALETRKRMRAVLEENSTNDMLSGEYVGYIQGKNEIDGLDSVFGKTVTVDDPAYKLIQAAGIDVEDAGITFDNEGNVNVDEAFGLAYKRAVDIYNAAQSSISAIRDSTVELNELLATGDIYQEDYDANMRRLATTYADTKDELNEYNEAVRLYTQNSKQAEAAQKKLNKAVRQAEIDQAAVDILTANKNLKELTSGTDDYIAELENQAKAFNTAFATSIDTSFVEQYQDEIKTWAEGGEGAEDMGAYLAGVAKANSIQWNDIIGDTENFTSIVASIINGTNGTIVVDGKADLTTLMNALSAAKASGETVAKIIQALGYTDIQFEGNISGEVPDLNAEPKKWTTWFDNLEGGFTAVSATIPADLGTPDMENVANKMKSSSGGGGGEKKKLEDEIDRYHESKATLSSLERATADLAKAKDEAFGQTRVDIIEKETKALEKELQLLEAMDDEILNYLAQDKANIAQYGAEFDEYGNISNYNALIENMLNKNLAGEISDEEYTQFKEWLGKYEESLSEWYSNQEAKSEKQREIVQNQIDMINAKVEIELELSEKELRWIEYQISKLEDEAFSAAKMIDLISQKTNQALADSTTYQAELTNLEALAAKNLAEGKYTETGGWNAAMKKEAEEAAQALLDANLTLMEQRKEIEEQFGLAIEESTGKLDEQISRFDSYGSILDNYKNIIGLSGKSIKDSALLIDLGNKSVQNSINKLESARQKQEVLESSLSNAETQYENALLQGDEETIKYWEETVEDITSQVEQGKAEVLATFQETLQAAADSFAAAVEQTMAVFSANMTTFKDLDIASDNYEKQKTLAEQYLDINTQNYELSKLMRNINAEIDKTDNLASKIKLRDVLEEINEIQANNTELSQYDLDMLNAKYQLRLAEIALEEAQNAKNQVRLTQTAGGGWGYVYTADQDAIDKAEQNYEDKLYNIQKLSQDRLGELSDNILQNYQEYRDAVGGLKAEDFENKEAYLAEIDRLTEYYTNRDKYLQSEFDKAVKASGQTYKDTLLGQTLDAESYQEAHNNFVNEVNKATDSMSEHYDTWKKNVSGAYEAAGEDESGYKDKFLLDAESIIETSKKVKQDISAMADEMSRYLGQVASNIVGYQTTYGSAIDAMILKNEALITQSDEKFKQLSENGQAHISELEKALQSLKDKTGEAFSGTEGSGNKTTSPYDGTKEKDWYVAKAVIGEQVFSEVGNSALEARQLLQKREDLQNALRDEFGVSMTIGELYRMLEEYITVTEMDTGGYTGTWGAGGKLAMLHEKEIVLNKADTENLLTSIEIVRSIAQQLDALSQYQRMFDLMSVTNSFLGFGNQQLEQNVHITADFPNVTDHNEIEEAFNNLINYSSQYINRYNK